MKNKDQSDVLNSLENANSYVARSILEYAVGCGCGTNDIARMAGVSRATIHNWTHGHQARYANLARIIAHMGIEDVFPEKIFHMSRLAGSFDAKDIRLHHALSEEINKLSVAIKENVKAVQLEKLVTPPALSCIALWGRKLIDCALSKKHNLTLLLLPIGYVDLKSQSLNDDYERFSAALELELDESNISCYVFEVFDSSSKRKTLEDEILQVLSLPEREYLNELLARKVPVKQYILEWGFGDTGNELQWFLEWLSDYDGQDLIKSIFNEIRQATAQNANKLELEVWSVEKYLDDSKKEFLQLCLENRSQDDGDEFDAEDYLDDYEVPIELYREESSYIYDEREIPVSPAMVKFFFTSMGFQINFICDKPVTGAHKVIISW